MENLKFFKRALKHAMNATRKPYTPTNNYLWWDDLVIVNVLLQAEKLGWVKRTSHTQVEWTQAGVDAVKEPEPKKTFKVGEKVATRAICNHDTIFRGEVVKRTTKTVTISMYDGREVKRCKVHEDSQGEFIYPTGRYSMAPIFRAGRNIDE